MELAAVSDLLQMLDAAASNLAADVAFGILVLGSFAIAITCVLFFLLAVRGTFRFLTRRTWSDVVRSAERKALR
jgi:hypothetical protein